MNNARLQSILANVSAVSRRVYESVPIEGPWSKADIHHDLLRRNRGARDLRITEGCLKSLKAAGLVTEPQIGHFVRAKVKVKSVTTSQSAKNACTETRPPREAPKFSTPIELLSGLSEKAISLSQQVKALSEEIESAALLIDEYVSARDAEHAKLLQLKSLLKDLG